MKCFGYNDNMQLGLGLDDQDKGDNENEMGSNLTYVNPGTIDNAKFKSVYCGVFHTCSIFTNDKAKCWGSNDSGRLGAGYVSTNIENTGDTLPFIDFGDTDNIKSILFAVGREHACMLFNNKKVKCFGSSNFGQLGYEDPSGRGSSSSHMGNNLPFVNFGTDIFVSSIHSFGGAYHTCIVIYGSQLMKCWGLNSNYQLGYNDDTNRGNAAETMGDKLPTLNLGTASEVLQVSVGTSHTCAVRVDKELRCWGSNVDGQLGLGTSTTPIPTSSPLFVAVKVHSDTTIKAKYVSAGSTHTCVLLNDDISAKCVGNNDFSQLGQGDNVDKGNSPSNTMDKYPAINLGTGNLKIKTINAGGSYTCAIFEDSTIKCFGFGGSGRIGSGSSSTIGTSPSQMGNNLPFVDIFETTSAPTKNPTYSPVKLPSKNPTKNPSKIPSKNPSKNPTKNPSNNPTMTPTMAPTKSPSFNPTKAPTYSPTKNPTKSPVLGCQYTNQKKCKKDKKCMWRNVGEGGECTVADCTVFERKNCKLHDDICNWKKNKCFPRE